MKQQLLLATALAVLLAWGGDALAQTPKVVHVAGKLTDAAGEPIADAEVDLNFKLYDDSAAGDLKYNEPHTNVPVSGGWFDAYIGSSVPLSPGNVDYESLYLQIDVNGVAMSPRLKVGGSFYALAAYKLTEEGYGWLVERLAEEPNIGGGGEGGDAGERGPRGYSCWDLNGNGQNDDNEDANGDDAFNALDCQGAPGERGLRGYACWDLNANGNNDANEDSNGDGAYNGLDCQGDQGDQGDAADAVAAICVALVGDANCNLADAVNQVCGCQDIEVEPIYAGSLTRQNGLWNYGNGQQGVPSADLACNAAYAGAVACTYSQLIAASGRNELANPTDNADGAVTSWWANDPNADVEQQCSHNNANEAPWTYQTADQGDRGLFVTVNRGNGNLAAPALAGCNNGDHWVACCNP